MAFCDLGDESAKGPSTGMGNVKFNMRRKRELCRPLELTITMLFPCLNPNKQGFDKAVNRRVRFDAASTQIQARSARQRFKKHCLPDL